MIQIVIFFAVSTFLVYVSRASLFVPRSHGFYRFFAWESIVALILLNAPDWVLNPFSIHQVISWLLLSISLVLVVQGFYHLLVAGKPNEKRKNPCLMEFEKTTSLVTIGVYKYIRHPLYGSLLFLAYGVFFKDPAWVGAALTLSATVFLTLTAKVEEDECIRFFGSAYQTYMQQTKMFVPFLF